MQDNQYPLKHEELVLRDFLATERTVLSNERTFLAYIRTAIAFAGGGVSLIHFLVSLTADIFGVLLIAAAVITFFIGVQRYIRTRGPLDKLYKSIRQ